MATPNTPNVMAKNYHATAKEKKRETELGTVFFNALSHETKKEKERRNKWG